MLILTRKVGETIRIGDNIEVVVLGVKGNQVRIGTNAPKERQGEYHYVLLNYPDQTNLILSASQLDRAPIAGASCWNSLMPSANIPASNILP